MADIRADVAGTTESHHCVHVCAVHVDLTAVRMHDLADAPHIRFEDAVSRRVCQHQRGQAIAMLGRLGFKVRQIDVALFIASHRHDSHAHHRGAGRIGPMRRYGDETDIPMKFPLAPMIGSNDHQAAILALRTRIRLQRDGGESGDLSQPRFQLPEQFLIPLALL